MKLQIHDQHLRLRVDEAELAQLLDGQNVSTRIALSAELALSCSVLADAKPQAQVGGSAEHWQVTLPLQALRDHAAVLPSRDGLVFNLKAGQAAALELRFDVDVRDSVRRRYPKNSRTVG